MTFQEYLANPLHIDVDEREFAQLEAYARVGIKYALHCKCGAWVDTSAIAAAIKDATCMQIAFVKAVGVNNLIGGKIVKAENLDGYSRQYDFTQFGSVYLCTQAVQCLDVALSEAGLTYRGL